MFCVEEGSWSREPASLVADVRRSTELLGALETRVLIYKRESVIGKMPEREPRPMFPTLFG